MNRYDYASYKTLRAANNALDEMFSCGDVLWGERPEIEHRNGRYYITLLG